MLDLCITIKTLRIIKHSINTTLPIRLWNIQLKIQGIDIQTIEEYHKNIDTSYYIKYFKHKNLIDNRTQDINITKILARLVKIYM